MYSGPTGAVLIGYADHRVWFNDPRGLLCINEATAEAGLFSFEQLGIDNGGDLTHVTQIDGQVCLSSNLGIHLLEGPHWKLQWPLPEGIQQFKEVASVAGKVYANSIGQLPVVSLWLGVPAAALLSGLSILGIRRLLRFDDSLFKIISRPYLLLLVATVAPLLLTSFDEVSMGMLPAMVPIGLSALLLMGPPLVIIMIVLKYQKDRVAEKIQLRPVRPNDMPLAASAWFERNTPALESLGFHTVGDYRLKQQTEQFSRYFCHEEGDLVVEICWLKRPLRQTIQSLSSFSITEEGTYLETGTLSIPNEPDDEHFIMQCVLHGDVVEMLEAHRHRLWQLKEARDTRSVELDQHNLEQAILYGQKLLYRRFMRNGLAQKNSYEGVSFASQDQPVAVAM